LEEVRARARNSGIDAAAVPYIPYTSQTQMRTAIKNERRWEFAMEGYRFYDLVRWHKGELLKMPWNGFYVPAVDVPMDLNGDGKPGY
jgi:hypothetical protein